MPIFVVHRHAASHLHWDLRLSMESVLRSWAIPKEPPRAKGIKRLAIQVEDHPISHAKYEGTIAEGMYGAGTVKIWDSGKYDLKEKTEEKIVVTFHGSKLNGEYALIKMKSTKYPGKKNWLFFKL